MKTFLVSTFVLCLASAAPTALWAADEHHEQGAARGAPPQQHAPAARPTGGGHTQQHATTQRQGGQRQSGQRQSGPTRAATVQSTGSSQHRRAATGTAGRSTTRARVAVDVTSYHKNVTAERQYHFGTYNAPQGYAYHRYSYGESLPQGYYAQSFWITNYLNFGLIAPPDGYVWVRYGPDAILLDEDTGEIVQIVYDQFY